MTGRRSCGRWWSGNRSQPLVDLLATRVKILTEVLHFGAAFRCRFVGKLSRVLNCERRANGHRKVSEAMRCAPPSPARHPSLNTAGMPFSGSGFSKPLFHRFGRARWIVVRLEHMPSPAIWGLFHPHLWLAPPTNGKQFEDDLHLSGYRVAFSSHKLFVLVCYVAENFV